MGDVVLPEFQSKKLSKHLGMTLQGLLWYEREGFVSPNQESGRRSYSIEDYYLLSRIRSYRQSGFSLQEITELLELEMPEIAKRIEDHAQILKIQNSIDAAKIEILEERAALLQSFEQNEGLFKPAVLDAFYLKQSMLRTSRDKKVTQLPVAKHWILDMPFAQYCARIDSILTDDDFDVEVGLLLPEAYLPFVSFETRAEIDAGAIEFVPRKDVLYGLIRTGGISDAEFCELLRETCSESIVGKTMLKRPATSVFKEDDVVAFWEVWLY